MNKKLARRAPLVLMAVAMVATIYKPEMVIDGVTAATSTPAPPAHPAPSLTLSSSQKIVNNQVRVLEGQTISVSVSATDPNGYNSLEVGLVNGGFLYTRQSDLNLPDNAQFTVSSNDPTKASFVWTPALGASGKTPVLTLKFGALNTYWNTSKTQTVTINVDDNLAPSFDSSMTPISQTVKVDTALKIPVVVNPDPDNDSVVITASGLPHGAKLSKPVKNAKKQWLSQLTWTPGLAQIGTHDITLIAMDDKLNPAQTTYPLALTVVYVDPPSFEPSLASTKTIAVNKTLSYKVIANADTNSKYILISSVNLLPAGAKLSKPKKVKNQWIATLTWKPKATQLGDHLITFSAQDPAAGPALPVTFDLAISVTSS